MAVAIAQDTAKRELRAYVSVSRMRLTGMVPNSTKAGWSVEMMNDGATPAKRTRSRIWVVFGKGESQGKIFSKSSSDPKWIEDESIADIPPGKPYRTGEDNLLDGVTITDEIFADILAGTLNLYLVGIITYKDVFGATRRTIFKGLFDPQSVDSNGNGKLSVCRTGNRST